jgi:hypothetical protein
LIICPRWETCVSKRNEGGPRETVPPEAVY